MVNVYGGLRLLIAPNVFTLVHTHEKYWLTSPALRFSSSLTLVALLHPSLSNDGVTTGEIFAYVQLNFHKVKKLKG